MKKFEVHIVLETDDDTLDPTAVENLMADDLGSWGVVTIDAFEDEEGEMRLVF